MNWDTFDSPIGPLTLVMGDTGLRGIRFDGHRRGLHDSDRSAGRLAPASAQLSEYFAGERDTFDIDLELVGSPFQERVWHELLTIPYGTTVSYGALAERVEHADVVRAVAATVGRTPIPIVVPCHRVIGSDGSLTGYGGGLDRKRALLELEASRAPADGREPAWAFRQMSLG
jgi:methylated-DNA-[protein]-cysteine S-methyltransferase